MSTAGGLPYGLRGLLARSDAPYWQRPGLWALVLALLALVLGGILFYRRRRREAVEVNAVAKVRERFAELAAKLPFSQLNAEIFYYELSLILRQAFALACGIGATELTVDELKAPLLRLMPLPESQMREALTFLGQADLIKFAAATTSLEMAQRDKARVGIWLEQLLRALDAKVETP